MLPVAPPPAPAIPSVGTSLQTCSCSPVRPGDTVTARHSASGIHRAPVLAMAAATAVATAAAQPVRAPAPRPRPRQRPGLRAPAATCPRPRERHPPSPPATGIGTGRGTPRERRCASPRGRAPGTQPLGTTRGITPGNGNEQWITKRSPWNGRQHSLPPGALPRRTAPGIGIENGHGTTRFGVGNIDTGMELPGTARPKLYPGMVSGHRHWEC